MTSMVLFVADTLDTQLQFHVFAVGAQLVAHAEILAHQLKGTDKTGAITAPGVLAFTQLLYFDLDRLADTVQCQRPMQYAFLSRSNELRTFKGGLGEFFYIQKIFVA